MRNPWRTLGAAAAATGLSRDTIRRYERRGFIRPKRNVLNFRLFDGDTIQRLQRIAAGESFLKRPDGEVAVCESCKLPILERDGYGSDRDGRKARRFWCEQCAAKAAKP